MNPWEKVMARISNSAALLSFLAMLLFGSAAVWAVGALITLSEGPTAWGTPVVLWALGVVAFIRVRALDRLRGVIKPRRS